MNKAFLDYYRCPEMYASFTVSGNVSAATGYFRLGSDTVCYGQFSCGASARSVKDALYDALQDVRTNQSTCVLPFNPTELIDNLRYERYIPNHAQARKGKLGRLIRDAYYLMRPLLPVHVRKHLQRASLRDWDGIPFPSWPVDRTVEHIQEKLLVLALRTHRVDRIPFIWFWPDGCSGCTILTHDVETSLGLHFCPRLMDIDDSFGIKASFQIVPEQRYAVSPEILGAIRDRGFEINIHDFNHDGRLFRDREIFLQRASRINRYVKEYATKGFRSGALYRNLDWYDAFAFSYDMSVPNVGHLDPQRGGCCTVMPYFVGDILELPLTTIQDYSLFNILAQYSIELWQRQISLILEKHGLVSFIIHPDYINDERAQNTYRRLLAYLSQLCSDANIWIALPREVDTWWRQRNQMQLVNEGGTWIIRGPGKERATVAFAMVDGARVSYSVEQIPQEARSNPV